MNDIEQFSKLKNHAVTPPAAAWQALSQSLQQKRRKRRAAYWWVAASVALLGVTIAWLVGMNQTKPTPLAKQIVIDSAGLEELALPTDNQYVSEQKSSDSKSELMPEQPVASQEKQSAALPEVALDKPILLKEELSVQAPSPLGKTEVAELAEVSITEKRSASQPTLVVDASQYRKSTPAADTLQLNEEINRPSSVTVIYQPNPSTLAEKKSLGEKIDRTLTFLEDHGISYSELRSAKSDLVDKLFSGKDTQEKGP